MAYLLDTGILLRLVNALDVQHSTVVGAVAALGDQRETLVIATQNVAEFCNVLTRPIAANGLALTPSDAIRFLERDIEPICQILAEGDAAYEVLKRLVAKYVVVGKQVHDARLVAMMLTWQIENVLTLNERDFRRYEPEGIRIVTPESLTSASP